MIRRVGVAVCALVLLAVSNVAAQQIVTGTVVRIDQPANVVMLDNGQMYRATPQTVFLVNDRPATFTTIQPGTRIVFHSAQPVAFRNGQYVLVTDQAPVVAQPVVVQPAPVAAQPVIVQPAPVAAVPTAVFEISGVVRYVGASEPGRASLTLDDGRHVWIDENTQVLANGAPVMISTVKPGTFVVIRSAKPLAFRNHTYVTTTTTTTTTTNPMVRGTVVRFDQPNMIVLSDGRAIPATNQTVVMVDNRPVPLTTLQPGMPVVIYPQGTTAVIGGPYPYDAPYASPSIQRDRGLRERELERNAP